MVRIPYDKYWDLELPDHIAELDDPKGYILSQYGDFDNFLTPKRQSGKFSSKSGPKGPSKKKYLQ